VSAEAVTVDHAPETLPIPADWADVTPAWMTTAVASRHPDAVVDSVTLLLRDDGTNRRARFGVRYARGSGPATVFVKSEAPAHRRFHARNGNLFNEPRLFAAGVPIPVDHPLPYCVVIDEPGLDYVIVMEDLDARGADLRDATRPMTVEQVARGLRALARLHSRYWTAVDRDPALGWVQPFEPLDGWQAPMKVGAPMGLDAVGDVVPPEVRRISGEELVGDLWARFVWSLADGPATLLHGDPHIGNTYVLPDGEVGFLDWQVVRHGNWSVDVGYFVQGALTVDDRRAAEHDLVAMYVDALDVPACDRPTAEDAFLRYRASAVHGLTLWLTTSAGSVQSPAVCRALVERYAGAFVDLDARGAIERGRA
jgi:aminoglycoside phosphotransferase (APT) family kinase protein